MRLSLLVIGLLSLAAAAGAAAQAVEAPVHDAAAGGTVRDWVIVGGFPNRAAEGAAEGQVSRTGHDEDFLAPVGGEAAGVLPLDSGVPFTDRYGNERTAMPRLVSALPAGVVDLNQAFLGADYQVAYAYCQVRADEAGTLNALFGSDDSAKVWVNGRLVHSVWSPGRGVQRWEDRFPVELHAGLNDMLVKVEEAIGGWGFSLELYADEDMDAARVSRLESVAFTPSPLLVPEGATELSGEIAVAPADEPLKLPVKVELRTLDNELISWHDAATGAPVALPLPEGYAGYVKLRMTVERAGLSPLEGEGRAWVGDFAAEKGATLALAREVAARLRAEAGSDDQAVARAAKRQLPIARFAEEWLAWEHEAPDTDLEVFGHVQRAITAMAEGRDYQTEHPGSLPVLLDMPDGSEAPAVQFWVSLPCDYSEHGGWPVLIHLHGGGGSEQWVPDTTHPDEGALWNYRMGVHMPYVSITVRRVGTRSWNPEMLDLMLDHVLAVYDVDADRVGLTGFSFGGYGTYGWALHSPERFAALAVLAGGTATADLWKIRHIPIWIAYGERDQAVPPYTGRMAADALRELGGDVRLTTFPDRDHDIQQPFQRGWEFWRWMAGQRRREMLPAPADSFAEPGTAEPELKDLPAATYLYVPLEGAGLRGQRSQMSGLYTAAYGAGADVLSPAMLRIGADGAGQAIGLLVSKPVTANPDLLNADLPAARCYSARYRGPADGAEAARERVRQGLQQAGAALTGEVRELVRDIGRGDEVLREYQFILKGTEG